MSNSNKPAESKEPIAPANAKDKEEGEISDEELKGVAGGTSFAVLLNPTSNTP